MGYITKSASGVKFSRWRHTQTLTHLATSGLCTCIPDNLRHILQLKSLQPAAMATTPIPLAPSALPLVPGLSGSMGGSSQTAEALLARPVSSGCIRGCMERRSLPDVWALLSSLPIYSSAPAGSRRRRIDAHADEQGAAGRQCKAIPSHELFPPGLFH